MKVAANGGEGAGCAHEPEAHEAADDGVQTAQEAADQAQASGLAAPQVASRRACLDVVPLVEASYSWMPRHKLEDRLMRMSRQAGNVLKRDESMSLCKKQLAQMLLGGEGRLALLREFDEEVA